MWLFKFEYKSKANFFFDIIKIINAKEKTFNPAVLNDDLLLLDFIEETDEKELFQILEEVAGKFSGKLVPPERFYFEKCRFRFTEYEKCLSLENFVLYGQTNYKRTCYISLALLKKSRVLLKDDCCFFAFIGPEAESFLKSFLTHQFAIYEQRFCFPKNQKELDKYYKRANEKKKIMNFVLNEKQDFFSFNLLSNDKYREHQYINILICCQNDVGIPRDIEHFYVQKKEANNE